MRLKVMTFILIGICFLAVQAAPAAEVQFGIKGGANRAQTSLDNPPSDQDRGAITGFGGGAVLTFGLGEVISLDTEILYLQKGVHTEAVLDDGNWAQGFENDFKLDYVTFSPLLKIGGQGKSFSPYFIAGPEISYLVKATANETYWYGSPSEKQKKETTLDEFMEELTWGWTAGGGLEIPTESVSIFFEGRYAQGLSNIWTQESTSAWGEEKPSGIYIFGGIRF
ncbi:MAG: PorT family protein [Candidatus Eisenbacteria bacterium]|uniref:PorT family protein n=1 Tax=Eiseniibacteriota bacterium TaxID=2212470 RepID=A0A948RX71_UNCEI|nr:PorT family protein [Candidatus Eisenbacteria bacterium]MBU1949054.1 PorT family protein [Candidatus Eisenbacteria bacterium]MBU2692688.1 PorT family protein [Candidatus Eisenbacteria bacterium]